MKMYCMVHNYMEKNDRSIFRYKLIIVISLSLCYLFFLARVMICLITKVPLLNLLKCQKRTNIYIRIITTIT